MAWSLSYNNIDLSTYGLYAQRGAIPIDATAKRAAVSLAGRDGDLSSPTVWNARVFSIPCIVQAATPTALQTALDNIALALNEQEDCALKLDGAISDRYWQARYVGGGGPESLSPCTAAWTLNFVADDPHAYSTTESTATATLTAKAGGTSETKAATVGGSDFAYPDIEIVASTATNQVKVANEALSQYALWTSPATADNLANGDTIRFRSDRRYLIVDIKRSGADSYVESMAGFDGRFVAMSPGVSNTITIWNIDGALTIRWRNRYL